jgi:hypothetical protein
MRDGIVQESDKRQYSDEISTFIWCYRQLGCSYKPLRN